MLGHFSIIPLLSPFMVSNVGFTEHQLAYIYLLGGGVTIFTSPLIGRLADKYGKQLLFNIFACLALVPLLLLTNMEKTSLPIVLAVTSLFFVTSSGRSIPAQAMVISTVAPQERGGFMSINSSIMQLSTGAASLISGFVVYKNASGHLVNYQWVGLFAAICSLLCILIAAKLKPINPEAEKPLI